MIKIWTTYNLLKKLENPVESDYFKYEVLLNLNKIVPFKADGDPKYFKIENYFEKLLNSNVDFFNPIDKELVFDMLEECKKNPKYGLHLLKYVKNFLYSSENNPFSNFYNLSIDTYIKQLDESLMHPIFPKSDVLDQLISFIKENNEDKTVQIFSNGYLGYLLPHLTNTYFRIGAYDITKLHTQEIKAKTICNLLNKLNTPFEYTSNFDTQTAVIFALESLIKDCDYVNTLLTYQFYENIDLARYKRLCVLVPTAWLSKNRINHDFLAPFINGKRIQHIYQFQNYGVSIVNIDMTQSFDEFTITYVDSDKKIRDIKINEIDLEETSNSLSYEDYIRLSFRRDVFNENLEMRNSNAPKDAFKINFLQTHLNISNNYKSYFKSIPHEEEFIQIGEFLDRSNDLDGDGNYSFKIYRGYQADEVEITNETFKFQNGKKETPTFYFLKPDAIDQSIEYLDVTKLHKMNPRFSTLLTNSKENESTLLKLSLKPWDIIISNRLSPTKPMVLGGAIFSRFHKSISSTNNEYIIPSGAFMVIRCGNEYAAYYLKKYLESDYFKQIIQNKYGDKLNSTFVSVKDFPEFAMKVDFSTYREIANRYHQLIGELHKLGEQLVELRAEIDKEKNK